MSQEQQVASDKRGVLAWTSLPVRDDGPKALVLIMLIVAISAGIGWSFASVAWAAFSLAVLVTALRQYFVVSHIVVDEAGVQVRSVFGCQRRLWSELKSYYPQPDGVFLSPFEQRSRLDPYRGLFLRYRGNKDAVEVWLAASDLKHRSQR